MRGIIAVICVLLVLVPRVGATQTPIGEQAPRPDEHALPRWSLHVAAGATIPSGNGGSGDVQSLSIGYSPTPSLTVLVGGGRSHMPPHGQEFAGGFSGEPGGTLQFVGAEVRFALRPGQRVSPYAFAGAGVGVWRRNQAIAEPLRNTARVVFSGGGLAVALGRHFSISGDVGIQALVERDVPHLFLPVRAGLVWRF